MTSRRLFLWSLVAALLLMSGPTNVQAQQEPQEQQQLQQLDELEVDPSQQRRELWDFFSFVSLMMKIPGPPCTRPNGSQDWGPEGGPRWRHCSEDSSSSSSSSETSEVSEEAAVADQEASSGTGFNANLGMQWWMVIVAGSVVSAVAAIAMGQRRPAASQQRHGMAGSVMRRVGAVSAFAAGAFPGRKPTTTTVEMQSQGAGYRLDMDPEHGQSATV